MKFRTEIHLPDYPFKIDYSSRIFGLGSCFVDHIKEKLHFYQFRHLINDFGVVFNPYSLLVLLQRTLNRNFYTKQDIFLHGQQWKSFELHSSLNHSDSHEFLKRINAKLQDNYVFIKQANLIIFTFGTAWVYKHKQSGLIVNNCHKLPAAQFEKIILSPAENTEIMHKIIALVKKYNPNAHLLLTVSPVRHLKDGFIQNQRSKAHLIAAVHAVTGQKNVHYFPSYEILMDDLRDYRFYTTDMLHPNAWAVDYVWEKFTEALIRPEAFSEMKKIEKIQKSLQHKAFDESSEAYRLHRTQTLQQIERMQEKYPWMPFENGFSKK